MTTIAITATECAADGQRTYYDQIRGRDFKKLRVSHGAIYAFTGLVPMLDVMVKWHVEGADPEKLPSGHDKTEDGWTLIVIQQRGICKYTSKCPYPEWFEPPMAFGAGQDYAMGAMLHGASAKEAIAIVSNLCNHTGGDIQVLNIADALATPVKEAAE